MAIESTASDLVQEVIDFRVDMRDFSEFLFEPPDVMITRRLAPPINTLQFYLDALDRLKDLSAEVDIDISEAIASAENRFFDVGQNRLADEIELYVSASGLGGNVFDTAQAGIDGGVINGGYYSVRSSDDSYYLDEYKNVAGVAQATGKKYPSAKLLQEKGIYTVNELLTIAASATTGARFNTQGFYSKGDTLPSVFEIQTVVTGDVSTDIGNGILIGNDASIKVNATKKLKLIANDTVALSQLGGVKTAQSVVIKNDVVGSIILKNFKELVIDGFYTLRGTIWHYENNVICGIGKKISGIKQGDNVNKYPIQSFNSNLKAIVHLNESLEMRDFTLDGNTAKNGARDYTQDINLTYWGFGALICNVADFYIHDMHVKDTEAWGISYHLCDKVHAENLTFDQKLGDGANKDGITGSGKRVTYKDISGYTSDDLCATTCGRCSLAANNCGVSVEMDVEYIHVSNICGVQKDGDYCYTGVGIYGKDGAKIKSVVIDNVYGDFKKWIVRFANYWYVSEKLNVESVIIRNIPKRNILYKKNTPYLVFTLTAMKKLMIEDIHYTKDGDTSELANIVSLVDSPTDLLKIDGVLAEQTNSTQNIALVVAARSMIKNCKIDNIKATCSEVITQDKNIESGSFTLLQNVVSGMTNITLGSIDIGNFKLHGYLMNLWSIDYQGQRTLFWDIANLTYPEPAADYIIPSAGVTISASRVSIKNSHLYLFVNGSANITDANVDKNLFTFGEGLEFFNKQEMLLYYPKLSAYSAAFTFKVTDSNVIAIVPSYSGTEVGQRDFLIRAVIPLV